MICRYKIYEILFGIILFGAFLVIAFAKVWVFLACIVSIIVLFCIMIWDVLKEVNAILKKE